MACDYVLLAAADYELDSILTYLSELSGGQTAAKSFMCEFEEKVLLLCENPALHGLSRMPELASLGYRAFFVKNYVVLYFYREGRVFIAHIFHQRQDYARFV